MGIRALLLATMAYVRISKARLLLHGGAIVTDPLNTCEVADNVSRLEYLIEISPTMCGPLAQATRRWATVLTSDNDITLEQLPNMENTALRAVETDLGWHVLGYLQTCAKRHVYCAKTFTGGCPSCPKDFKRSDNELYRDAAAHLDEPGFLKVAAQKSMSSSRPANQS
jgi:hypothetical protein